MSCHNVLHVLAEDFNNFISDLNKMIVAKIPSFLHYANMVVFPDPHKDVQVRK